ncbi:MAG TPA: DUF58 domain-containing protein [Burkholderiaceae bacterium]|nr:DUF58 domain-containing protein [Burkholderiaceae bacterium]
MSRAAAEHRWRGALRRRWRGWWNARHPRSDQVTLTQRNVYILPTGAGWLFALLLLTLLVASINYQLNLGHLLTFVLAGVGLSSMHSTHATLRGLTLAAQAGEPVFAGEVAQLQVTLSDGPADRALDGERDRAGRRGRWQGILWRRRPRPHHGIGLRLSPVGTHSGLAARARPDWTWVDVPAGGHTTLRLTRQLAQRGWQSPGAIAVETRFPFGLFRAWTVWRPAARWLAWPAPEQPAAPLPWRGSSASVTPESVASAHAAPDEPGSVRAWRRGDSLAQVHWRRSAQSLAASGTLVSREPVGSAAERLQLDWTRLDGLDGERRIARLTAWVLAAEQAGAPYALALPGQSLATGLGPVQRRQALDRLAVWGLPDLAQEDAGNHEAGSRP